MDYSIAIPVYNEEKNIITLYRRLSSVMKSLKKDYELIFVNDGSTDRTLFLLAELHKKDAKVKIINFSRNFGHQMALTAGLKFTQGELVAVIDADLQDPPEILPDFFKKIDEGYDVVYAVRKKRKENFLLKFAYNSFYRLLKKMADIDIPLDAGDFCVMRKPVVETLNKLPERNRYLRGLRSWVGFKQTGISYDRQARYAGRSKYSLTKLIKLAFDGIFSFSYLPLQLMFYGGLASLFFSFLGVIWAVYQKFFTSNYQRVPGFATTIILVMFIGGLQLFSLGIVGEYMRRIYDETKQRPSYVIESMIGF